MKQVPLSRYQRLTLAVMSAELGVQIIVLVLLLLR